MCSRKPRVENDPGVPEPQLPEALSLLSPVTELIHDVKTDRSQTTRRKLRQKRHTGSKKHWVTSDYKFEKVNLISGLLHDEIDNILSAINQGLCFLKGFQDPDAGKDWGQAEKGTTEDEMVGWHYRLKGHEYGWTPGVGDGQGGLACCDSWARKESDTTEQLNWLRVDLLYLLLSFSILAWNILNTEWSWKDFLCPPLLLLFSPLSYVQLFCDSMDHKREPVIPPGSYAHGIFRARVLEWVAIAFSENNPKYL